MTMYKKAAIPKPSQEELANISNRLRLNLSEQELEQYAGDNHAYGSYGNVD